MNKDILTYGIVGLPRSLDPHNQVVPNDFATRVAFDSLLMPDDSGGLIPWLAHSYEPSGPQEWDFMLRDGINFASGRRLSADSIVWNFQRLAANSQLLAAARIPTLESCEAIDRLTVRFTTAGPDVIWPRRVLQVVIMDPEEATTEEQPTPSALAGTGLFRITDFQPGESVHLQASPGNWRGRPGLAGLRMLPRDPSSLLSGLLDGEIDFGYLSAALVEQGVRSGLTLQRILQSNVHMIRFNSTRAPFDDPRLREAVALALDLDTIVADRYLGEGRTPNQVVGDDCFGYDPNLPPAPYDPGRARELVAAARFSGELSMDILESSAVLRPWGDAAVEALCAIGLNARANYVGLPDYLGKLAANDPPRSELIGAGNQYGPGQDAEFSLNKFSSKLPAGQVEYDNPEFQYVYDASQIEFDPSRRQQMLRECTRLLLADHGCVPAYQPALSWLINPRVTGLSMNSIGAGWVDWRPVSVMR